MFSYFSYGENSKNFAKGHGTTPPKYSHWIIVSEDSFLFYIRCSIIIKYKSYYLNLTVIVIIHSISHHQIVIAHKWIFYVSANDHFE